MFFAYFLWLVGFFSMLLGRKKLIMVLLSFEMMMMGVFYQLLMVMTGSNMTHMMYNYMIMIVIEACFSLTLLVMMVNYYGSDLIKSYNLFNT